ncbi:MAG TPA: zinc ribbon domain-containing protein [Anaerolineales bacterium]|nr:zinc ribbon domain-containing protein [Anaerolineales bacterium]
MPVYTYRCDSCGVQFERHQSFHDAPLTTCPECRKKSLKKVITPTRIIFKGSGFYATDHRSPSGSKSSSENDSSESKPEKAEKKDESKTTSKSKE